MKNRTETRRHLYHGRYFGPKRFIVAGFVAMMAFCLSGLALHSWTAAAQDVGNEFPSSAANETGRSAADEVRHFPTLVEAIKSVRGNDDEMDPNAVTRLTAGTPRPNDYFGASVALSGETAVVGAPLTNNSGANNNGTAYVFVRNGSGWNQQQRLTTPDGIAGDRDAFGASVSISGNTLIVGAPRYGDEGMSTTYGAAYVYVRNGTTWTFQKKFSPTDTPLAKCEGQFGLAVAVSGDTALVTTDGCLQFTDHSAMVHVFARTGTNWAVQGLLTAIDEGNDDSFGASVALSGDVAVIGDPDTSGQGPEAAYIFYRCGTEWVRQQRLLPTGSGDMDYGRSVAISGNTAVVGAPNEFLGGQSFTAGTAYVYVTDGQTWTQQQKLSAYSGSIVSRYFGAGVGILGDTIVVGKRSEGVIGSARGQALTFTRSGTTWTQQQVFTGTGTFNDEFGFAVAISENAILAGAPFDTAGAGSAYAIDLATAAPTPAQAPCEDDIEVNVTTDQPDTDLEDDICDVDMGQSGNQCSLRAAIQTANAKEGPDEILFNIPGGGTHSISPSGVLPTITEKVSIDATTQPGYSMSPVIELRGSGQNYGLGFSTGSNDSLVSGFAINRFQASIAIESSGNRVEKCYIGLAPDGSPAGMLSENVIGIDLRTATATNNLIGGTGAFRNVISNNTVGVGISQGATGNKVLSNRIGTNAAGTSAISNIVGAFIDASSGNRIGDTVADSGNLISGSTGVAVNVTSGSTNNLIAGNLIGTNAAGTEAIANANGVILDASSNNRLGSDTGQNGNLISGSTFTAVTLKAGSASNVVASNKIGTNLNGTVAIPNKFGVGIDGASGNTIGDLLTNAKGNLISGNSDMGVVLQGNSANNRISNNSIGTKSNGTEVLASGEVGVLLTGGARDNTIEKNVIGGYDREDSGSGIGISQSAGLANLVFENFIGVAGNGTTPLPNYFGIGVAGDGQTIGSPTRGNVIGKNIKAGIVLAPATGNPVVENNTIDGNLIGTTGTVDIGNDEFGIWLNAAANDNAVKNNRVSGNTLAGIGITDGSNSNDVHDNFIGINVGGTLPISNGIGIWVRQSNENTIFRNVVSGNDIGMLIGTNIGFEGTARAIEEFQSDSPSNALGTFTSGNRIHSNIVGIGPSGAVPNRIGIAVGENARNNFVGTAEGPNIISGNTNAPGWGILVGTLSQTAAEPTFPQLNTIQRNWIGVSGTQQAIPNTKGIVVVRASRNTFGGETDAFANYIVASTQEGILMSDGAGENIFLRNYVGQPPPTPRSGPNPSPVDLPSGAFGNGSHGILIENGAHNNILGGTTSVAGLIITNNGGNGIRLASTAGNGNRIGANSIANNTLPGIDLGGNGFTVNDPADPDSGPNNLQNYPTFSLSLVGGDLIVNYQVDSAPVNSVYGTAGIKVDFYEADTGGQGSTLLGTDQYLASDYSNGMPGTRQKNLGNAVALGVVAGDKLTATATDAEGNSSEFTPAVNAPGGAAGFEGDVAPRPNGDGSMNSTDVTQLRRFVSGLDTPNPATNEQQRIDCAPRSSFGDGVVNSTDVVQGRRYVAGLDPQTSAGGPASRLSIPGSVFVPNGESSFGIFTRELSIGTSVAQTKRQITVPIEMTSNGDEVAMSFTIEYDETKLTKPRVSLASLAPLGSTLTVNTTQPGRIGILIDSTEPIAVSALAQRLLTISFDVISDGDSHTTFSLTGSLAPKSVSDPFGNMLETRFRND